MSKRNAEEQRFTLAMVAAIFLGLGFFGPDTGDSVGSGLRLLSLVVGIGAVAGLVLNYLKYFRD